MIFETLFDWCLELIVSVFSVFEAVEVPTKLVEALYSILCYGTWVVGTDLLSIVFASITFWLSFKASVGLVIWIYKLIPFCG